MSGSWVLIRSGQAFPLVLDFDGLDDLNILPMHETYACSARGMNHSIYFGRRGLKGSAKREQWKGELLAFVKAVGGD